MTETTVADAPATSPATQQGPVEANAQAGPNQIGEADGQGATDSVNFIPKDVDLNTLDQKTRAYVEKINKDMVRGLTEKTQQLAKERQKYSDYDSLREKALALEQLQNSEAFQRYLQFAQQQQQAEPEILYTQEEIIQAQQDPAKFQELIQRGVQAQVQEIKTKQEEQEKKQMEIDASEYINAYADALDQKTGKKLRDDFDELLDLGLIQDKLLQIPVQNREQWPTIMEKVYRDAQAIYKTIYEKGKADAAKAAQQTVLNSSEKPSVSMGNKGTKLKNPNDVYEAMTLARNQLANR